MKRLWIGVGLLATLLILGILVTCYTDSVQNRIAGAVEQAASQAEVGQWEKAAGTLRQAKTLWKKHHHLTAAVADHEPMEEVESLFAQLEVHLKFRENAAFSACCAALQTTLRAIGEAHSVNWWTLL